MEKYELTILGNQINIFDFYGSFAIDGASKDELNILYKASSIIYTIDGQVNERTSRRLGLERRILIPQDKWVTCLLASDGVIRRRDQILWAVIREDLEGEP